MIYCPKKYINPSVVNVNEQMHMLKGELGDKEARLTLIDFLRSNVGLMVELLSGIKLAPHQEIILKGMLSSERSMCVLSRGGAKCELYSPDNQLLTKGFGLVSITDLLPNLDFTQGEKWIDVLALDLWNGKKWVETKKVLLQPSVQTREITTKRGYSLSGSVNHLIKIWDKANCEIQWKKFSEIQIGDIVAISRKNVEFFDKNALKYHLQVLFETNGTISKNSVKINFRFTSITLAKQVHTLLSLFGITSSLNEHRTLSRKYYEVSVSGYNAKLFYDRIGFRSARKQSILAEKILNNFNTNLDVIPGLIEYCAKRIKSRICLKKEELFEWRNIERQRKQKNLTYDSLNKYVTFFEKVSADALEIRKLKNIIEEDYFFDTIKSVEDIGLKNCVDFNIPDGECYWSNGFINHNSFLAAVFCFVQCVFEPNTKVLLSGPTFRTSRNIFTYLENIINSPGAEFLQQAFNSKPSKRNDLFRWEINGGSISAIPLSGERIRGERANILIIDEYLLMPKDLIDNVLMPFLSSPLDVKERLEIREVEDKLIKEGLLKEEGRIKFKNNSKVIALSSASYTFENLYATYTEWKSHIYNEEKEEDDCKYFIAQLSYEALPIHMVDKSVIEEAKNGGSSKASFQREYCAQFVDESDGYFSAKNMNGITLDYFFN